MNENHELKKSDAASLSQSLRVAIGELIDTGKWRMAIIVILTVLRGTIPGVQVMLTGSVVGAISRNAPSEYVLLLAAGLGGAILIAYCIDNISKYLGDSMTIALSLRADLGVVDKLCDLEVQQFETEKTYDLVQRVDSSTGTHIFGLFDSLRSGIQSGLSIVGIALVVWSWSPIIAIMLLVAPIPAAIATLKVQTKAYDIDYSRAPEQRLASYYRSLLMSDSARKEVLLFDLRKILRDRYVTLQKKFQLQDLKIIKFNLSIAGTLGLISVVANIVAIILGALNTIDSGNVGELAGYISASTSIGPLVLATLIGFTGIYQHLLYISNWVAVLRLEPNVLKSGIVDYQGAKAASIEFRDVSFTYPGTNRKVLKHVSFTLETGKTTALVGLNGAGKTTLVKLLLRFYEPTSGIILLDGRNIAEYSRASLYRYFSALFQDFVKFERPLVDNIVFSASQDGYDRRRIFDSLRAVGLDYLPDQLPDGLETMLGRHFEGGRQLSIGQWQRLATARALYKSPSLLVLDEPTASVDAVSERAMFEAISRLDRNMTTVIVAHRFTTISHADKIIVMKDGEIHATGDHAALLEQSEYYREMFKAQVSKFF